MTIIDQNLETVNIITYQPKNNKNKYILTCKLCKNNVKYFGEQSRGYCIDCILDEFETIKEESDINHTLTVSDIKIIINKAFLEEYGKVKYGGFRYYHDCTECVCEFEQHDEQPAGCINCDNHFGKCGCTNIDNIIIGPCKTSLTEALNKMVFSPDALEEILISPNHLTKTVMTFEDGTSMRVGSIKLFSHSCCGLETNEIICGLCKCCYNFKQLDFFGCCEVCEEV